MDRVRATPAWRAMERAMLERTLLHERAAQDTIRAHMCGHVRAGACKPSSLLRDLAVHRNHRENANCESLGCALQVPCSRC
jgi:hypothetical protein